MNYSADLQGFNLSVELANVQNPRKGDFRAGVKINKNSRESKNFRSIIFPDNFS